MSTLFYLPCSSLQHCHLNVVHYSLVFFLSSASPHSISFFFFLMIRRPPRSTLDRSSAASDVYKRQLLILQKLEILENQMEFTVRSSYFGIVYDDLYNASVSYTHLRAHETVLDLVCRLLLEKKQKSIHDYRFCYSRRT